MAGASVRGLLPPNKPHEALRGLQLGLELVVAFRDVSLLLQVRELFIELLAYVLDAQQVFARVPQPELGLAAPLAVLGDARGLFEENAQLLRFRFDHARDHALLDDRVSARAQAGAEEYVGDIAPPHVHVVDVIGRVAIALKRALDRDLGVLRPLPRRSPEAVVENELDARAVHRLALAGAVEKHVLHGLAAQMLGGGFAQHPAHGVDYVRLAAAIGTDDADELAWNGNVSGIYERLETGEIDLG